MSAVLYYSLVQKWRHFLERRCWATELRLPTEDADDYYDELVDDFCDEHGYSDRTKYFAFYDRWWDTFKDDFYQELENQGVEF